MGKGKAFTDETLSWQNILCNVIYSGFLLVNCLMTAIGMATYQWIETTAEDMDKANIVYTQVPGLNRVSCGLTTYCIDAAGQVAECSLPWPKYGDSPTDIPYTLWQAAVGFMTFGLLLMTLCWIYTIFACFGCFNTDIQRWSSRMASVGGLFLMIGLLCWGGSFGDVAVSTCVNDEAKVDGKCTGGYQSVMPSDRAESGGDIGCEICPENMAAFQPATTCEIGWGAYIIVASTILSLFSGCIGEAVTSVQSDKERR